MTERGKSEESQRGEDPGVTLEALEALASYLQEASRYKAPAAILRRKTVLFRFGDGDADPPDIAISLQAEPVAEVRAMVGESQGGHAERDDAYYEEVQRAVGRGAPSVLLGTSTRSLERNLEKLKDLQQSDTPPQSSGSPRPSKAKDDESLSRRAIFVWDAMKVFFWVLAVLAVLLIIDTPAHSDKAIFIASAFLYSALSILMFIPAVRCRGQKWLDQHVFKRWPRHGKRRGSETTDRPPEKSETKKG